VTPEVLATEQQPLERIFDDLRVLLEARRQEYHAAAERITEILTSMAPKPRVGRPPKKG
jgi:hypothetical protein